MIVNNIDKMEKIVKSNPHIKWDGWNIVVHIEEDGYLETDGVFVDGIWKKEKRFEMKENGAWDIPDRFLINV